MAICRECKAERGRSACPCRQHDVPRPLTSSSDQSHKEVQIDEPDLINNMTCNESNEQMTGYCNRCGIGHYDGECKMISFNIWPEAQVRHHPFRLDNDGDVEMVEPWDICSYC
jgi:hypothetical protein